MDSYRGKNYIHSDNVIDQTDSNCFLKRESLWISDVEFSGLLEFYRGIANFLMVLFIGSFLGIRYTYMKKNILKESRYGYNPFIPIFEERALIDFLLPSELRSYLLV